ncbi:hypothetical protein GF322_01365 [Candidatus Dependentiae bacterium]|nr:hypothetical protein [Candidatus Dependentiae bacterium]
MKKIIKNVFFLFCINSIFAHNEADFHEDKISVNTSHLDSLQFQDSKNIALELNAVSGDYDVIEKEINSLKNNFNNFDLIGLDDEESKKIAPNFITQIEKNVQFFVKMAGIKTPKLYLYVGTDQKTYNASATTSITEITTVKTVTKNGEENQFAKKDIEKNYKLTLGENLVKLFFWNKDGNELLKSIIAHEIGHMYHNHLQESKESEYQADTKAVEFLGRHNGENLIKAIDMVTLAGHIYTILNSNAFTFKINLDEINHLIRVLVNTIIREKSDLAELGSCSSHAKFGYVVNNVFEKALQKNFNPKVGLSNQDIERIYQQLYLACTNLKDFMGSDEMDFNISKQCEYIEEYTNRLYSNITHPTPLERRINVQNCLM